MGEISIFDLLPGFTEAEEKASKVKVQTSNLIYETRKAKNMNQKEFAKLMGVTQVMVSKWESGHYNFSLEALAEIADKLDLNYETPISKKVSATKIFFMQKSADNDANEPDELFFDDSIEGAS